MSPHFTRHLCADLAPWWPPGLARVGCLLLVATWWFVTAGCAPVAPPSEEPAPTVSLAEASAEPIPDAWPQLLGPQLDSTSPTRGLDVAWGVDGPPVRWRVKVGRGYSAPVVASPGEGSCDVVLLAREGDEEVLRALDLATGEEQWRTSWPTTYRCKYEYSDGPYSTPVIAGEWVYAVSAQARLFCVERRTGQIVWSRDLAHDYQLEPSLFGFGSGMLVDEDLLILGCGGEGSGVIALDRDTGATRWSATDHRAAYTTPRRLDVQGRQLVLVLTEEGLVTLARDDGQVLHEYPFHSRAVDTFNAVTPQIFGSRVLLVSGPGPGAVVLDFASEPPQQPSATSMAEPPFFTPPREVWHDRRVLDSQFNSLVLHDGCVIGFSSSQQGGATLRSVDLATGKLRWKHTSALDRGQVVAADGKLIALGEHGHLVSLELDAQRAIPIAATEQPIFASPCYSQPAVARGCLLVRNEKELVCFELRPASGSRTAVPKTSYERK